MSGVRGVFYSLMCVAVVLLAIVGIPMLLTGNTGGRRWEIWVRICLVLFLIGCLGGIAASAGRS